MLLLAAPLVSTEESEALRNAPQYRVRDFYIPLDGKVIHVRKVANLPLEIVDLDAAVVIWPEAA